ncbi:MAG: bifunctional demethylmenaquinone methyltransferase/2-methoxy-6-polyprenyl-1,4-benzoquinol methylase UbiE [Tannerellaceae bacterium]|jgi:demethylmenaquinone methyltransferase/2-methoxy-6-polyprenyl-1,4-benzoquinol methylase|nr:bifunctional demethylmenaquinone methyltransferase/2-methoxy-6-polyprenyl-1,4-benzoquinol methylase UbiE [Tannerellaceae bacterium]
MTVAREIEAMFDSIAATYDALNHILSAGVDRRWRAKGINYLRPFSPKRILDVATGTGDLAIAMHKTLSPQQITGVDLSEKMMEKGKKKADKAGCSPPIVFERQDCLSLTYADNSFDAVTSAFGVRNFEHLEKGIAEMYRVLKPGGHLMILELSRPRQFPAKQLYALYSATIIPSIGRLFSGQGGAYRYLPASVKVVPQGEAMMEILRKQGFVNLALGTFTLGICSLYTGEKIK